MKKVLKTFGERPIDTHVLDQKIAFDHNGEAEVEEHIADILVTIPGYQLIGDVEDTDDETVEDDSEGEEDADNETDGETSEGEEDADEDTETSEEAPKKPARKAPARRAPRTTK